MRRFLSALLLCVLSAGTYAEDMLMIRSRAAFEESMLLLQQAISEQGYALSRVQRVDIGLSEFGYKTDKYRVVFFGKPEEIRDLSARYPELIPYLPLQIAIFAEADETLLVAANPVQLSAAYADPELDKRFAQWEQDMRAILEKVRKGGD
ncbi:MAG: DUF302 domain-containing protein [Gammaproteobacteria bacterium]|nr:DUF302 domain-containing protein [Gammaproteobacteria bacterium]MBU2478136.1 DUF302 domain-containing protein [Gammaproteobacteria bacterium]